MSFFSELLSGGQGGGGGGSIGFSATSGKSTTNANGTSKTTNTAFDAVAKGQLDAFTAQLLAQVQGGPNAEFSKDAATKDTRDAIANIFTEFGEQELPQILSLQSQSGTYSNTQTQQLANDALARTVGKAGNLLLDTIAKYAGIQQAGRETDTASLLGALQLQRDAFSTQDVVQTSTSSTSSKKKGFSLGLKF